MQACMEAYEKRRNSVISAATVDLAGPVGVFSHRTRANTGDGQSLAA
jgi:hypothetical protein